MNGYSKPREITVIGKANTFKKGFTVTLSSMITIDVIIAYQNDSI